MYEPIDSNQNVISIIAFIDGASFFKNSPVWAMFGLIADLHPLIRNSYTNIINFFMLATNKPKLNIFLKKHVNKDFEKLINVGINIIDIGNIKIKIIGFIADSQAIPKFLNTKQYNGVNGCIHCEETGEQISPNLRVYPFSKKKTRRTKDKYIRQLATAVETKKPCMGIMGPCWISKFINIPDDIILDYMHVCCIGTMQQQVNLWELSNNKFFLKFLY
jgi:hypothetical protein